MILIDHRGWVPANLPNKTQSTLDEMRWVKSSWLGGGGIAVSRSYVAIQYYTGFEAYPGCGVIAGPYEDGTWTEVFGEPSGSTGIGIQYGWDSQLGAMMGNIEFNAGFAQMPEVLKVTPDACTIDAAKLMLTGGTYTSSHETHTIDPNTGADTVTFTTDIGATNFVLCRLTRAGVIEVLANGAVLSGSESGSVIIDATAMVQAMHADRSSSDGVGYAIVPFPSSAIGEIEAQMAAQAGVLPDVGPINSNVYGPMCSMLSWEFDTRNWQQPSAGELRVKIGWPAVRDKGNVVQPRWGVQGLPA